MKICTEPIHVVTNHDRLKIWGGSKNRNSMPLYISIQKPFP